MSPELSQRIGAAFTAPDAPTAVRRAIVAAAAVSETFDDLPAQVQRMVEELEEQAAEVA